MPQAKKDIPEEEPKEKPLEESVRFTYPDGTIGTAPTRKAAADLMEEYRNGK